MKKTIEELTKAIGILTIQSSVSSISADSACKYSQAVLNLAHVLEKCHHISNE